MKYILGATTALLICSVALNLALLSGSLVTEKQVGALASQLAFSDPVAIMAGRE